MRPIKSLSQVLLAAALLFGARSAFAQGANTGALTGRVLDAATGQPVAGVTVVAQGPQGEQAELTDADGSYTITGLIPGQYVVRFYFANVKVERTNVQVFADKKIQVNVPIQTKSATAETYTITEKAPTVDVGSTKIGTTITKDFTANVPTRGRDFDTVANVAPGAQNDALGVSFSGTTSAENNYVVDGINITSVALNQAMGTSLGSALNLDFVQEIEVITGGYNAEYGRATGGVVNVITKSGSNEFHGDAAFYYDPGWGRLRPPIISVAGSSISTQLANLGGDGRFDFFVDAGGPIIKDRLWFYVGFEPIYTRTSVTRIVGALRDNCTQADPNRTGPCTGGPDGYQDYTGGQYLTDEIARSNQLATTTEYQWTGKLNLLVTPDHTLEVAYYGSPNVIDQHRVYGDSVPFRNLGGGQDAVAHWVSKLFDKKWQLEASLSYHRERQEHEFVDPLLEKQATVSWETDPVQPIFGIDGRAGAGPSLSWFEPGVASGCDTVSLSPMPTFNSNSALNVKCPFYGYRTGGGGRIENLVADRIGTRLSGTNFVRALGHHQFMYGWDFENNGFTDASFFPGGGYVRVQERASGKRIQWQSYGYLRDPLMDPTPDNVSLKPIGGNGMDDLSQCDLPDQIPSDAAAFCAKTSTINHALFLRDSWSILPNLTLNLGIRWERQDIQGVTDYENNVIGDPLVLNNNWAPRIGIIYDPTSEGKAKVYGSFARFYESIPLDINNRSFGKEGDWFMRYSYNSGCGNLLSPWNPMGSSGTNAYNGVDCPNGRPLALLGGEKSLVEPDLQGMYTDEIVVGGEYEIIEDLALGAYYTHRNLGPVIEDASVDNATTYYITNPGEKVSQDQLNQVRSYATKAGQLAQQAMQSGDMVNASRYTSLQSELNQMADNLPYFGQFTKPQRDYNAVSLTARKRFSKNWLAQASYTYARTIGNYPGLVSAFNGQIDPNITSQFDLPDLLHNRIGTLPTDIPHQFKVDGYYTWRLGGDNSLVTGTSFRAFSGSPRNYQGAHPIYGTSESALLPIGSGGRNDFFTALDLQIAYVRQLPRNMQLQLFFAIYNVYNNQTVLYRDNDWTFDPTNPIVNGRIADLSHLKTSDGAVAKPNVDWGRPSSDQFGQSAYQAPLFTRFGARFTF